MDQRPKKSFKHLKEFKLKEKELFKKFMGEGFTKKPHPSTPWYNECYNIKSEDFLYTKERKQLLKQYDLI